MKIHISVCFAMLLAACGGSDQQDDSPAPVTNPNDQPALAASFTRQGVNFYLPNNAQAGQSVALAAIGQTTQLTQINWQQTQGPAVTLLTPGSQLIAFDLPAPGNYGFRFTAQGVDQQIEFSAAAATESSANLRLDHVVPETGKASLRVDGTANKTIQKVTWQQTQGSAAIDLTVDQQQWLFFNAPAVSQDEILVFTATIEYSDGSQGSDQAWILIQDTQINSDGFFPGSAERIVSQVRPYRPNSPYAAVLQDCLYNNQISQSCHFGQLPLIGQQNRTPTQAQVMERLLVSHPWMGERFMQFLEQSPAAADILQLLAATTGVVISYDIRPSFYWSATGAIYLDAANFWVTPQERDTLNDQPDYRSDFGADLQFTMPWRYVKNGQSYIPGSRYPVAERNNKSFADMQASIVWLLYHELAHANDYFPHNQWANLTNSDTPLAFSQTNPPVSDAFSQQYPLGSQAMFALARVSFYGEDASEQQKAYLPADIETFFSSDTANEYYSYASNREDFANLFESFMMSYRMQVEPDIGILASKDNPERIVSWGQRNRFNHPNIQARTKATVNALLPNLNVDVIQQNLPATVDLTPGVSWQQNLDLNGELPLLRPESPLKPPLLFAKH